MNETERYMIKMLTGKDFEKEIKALSERGESQHRYNRSTETSLGKSWSTRLLGRYRCMKLRRSRLERQLRERLAFLAAARRRGAEPSWLSYGREKNSVLDMLREAIILTAKTERCEKIADGLSGRLREAVLYRYLDTSLGYMPDWKETAEHIGWQGDAAELRAEVTRAVSESIFDDS